MDATLRLWWEPRFRDRIPAIDQAGGRRATNKAARAARTGECIHVEAWHLAMLLVAAWDPPAAGRGA